MVGGGGGEVYTIDLAVGFVTSGSSKTLHIINNLRSNTNIFFLA